MKFIKKYTGLALMALGTATMAVVHMLHLTFFNVLLLAPLCLILLGLLLHVRAVKQESRY